MNIKYVILTPLCLGLLNLSPSYSQQLESDKTRIVKHLDGTIIIYNPVYTTKDGTKYPVSLGRNGLCAHYGYDSLSLVKELYEDTTTSKLLVDLSRSGDIKNYRSYIYRIKQIGCYNKKERKNQFGASSTRHNPDNSVTINNPYAIYSDEKYEIASHSFKGVCKFLGYKKHLMDTEVRIDKKKDNIMSIHKSGEPEEIIDYINKVLSKITCYNKLEQTSAQTDVYRNQDGSYTFEKPEVLYGERKIPIYRSKVGACAYLGFNSYVSGSVVDSDDSVDQSLKLKDDGSFQSFKLDGSPYEKITCKGLNYKNKSLRFRK